MKVTESPDNQGQKKLKRTNPPGKLVPGTPACVAHAREVRARKFQEELTPKQAMFVKEYIIDFNVSRAARAAGYSKNSANTAGHNFLKKPKIQKAIHAEMERRISRVEIRQDAIISELAALAFSDIRHIMSWNSRGIKLHRSDTLSAAAVACVAEVSCIDTLNGKNIRVKTHDKIRALELLMRHFGMLTDRMELDAKVVRSDEQKYHVIQEIISQPDVVDRVKENFRLRFRGEPGEG